MHWSSRNPRTDTNVDPLPGPQQTSPGHASRTARIQRKEADTWSPVRPPIARTGGGAGTPLAAPVQRKMEASFGADFSGVRVHNDDSAKDMGALAYTHGDDIHFARDQYQPHTQGGQELLGHELAHVVQQRAGRVGVQGKDAAINSDPALEREADVAGARAAAGERASVSGVSGDLPQRATSSSQAPIQRYTDVSQDDITTKQKGGEQLFTSHADTPSLADEPRQGIEYARSNQLSVQGLTVSEDGKLAAQKGVQAQEFYADKTLLPAWNQKLEAAGTAVRLVAGQSSITVAGNKLHIIKPTLNDNALQSLLYTECVDVANTIMGAQVGNKKFKAVFENANGMGAQQTMPMETSKASKVASYALGSGSTANIPGGVDGQRDKVVGKKYGEKLGRGKVDARAQEMGINQYARPDVGESFVAYSIRNDKDKTSQKGGTDYTQQVDHTNFFGRTSKQTQSRFVDESWDMHYGGVVAVSTDGADRVTLEDYNRGPEIDALKGELKRTLEQRYAKEIGEIQTEGQDVSTVASLLTALSMKLDDEQWVTARQLANEAISGGGKSTWYFAMYGSKLGQTFHDVGSEGTVNPLTMRVGKSD